MERWDTIEVGGSPMRVYVAWPDGAREVPAVMIAQHGPGVDRFIEDRVETLAAEGFLAAASAILVAQHGADVDRFIEDRVERSPPRAFWPRRPISIIASPPTAPT